MSAPHNFTLRQAQYALAVADTLSFHQAAKKCRVAQPSLSAQVAHLEDVLGVQLFERTRRRVLVTAQGDALLARMRALVLAADQVAQQAMELTDPATGVVTVGVIPTIAPYLLPCVAAPLHRALPNLQIRWIEEKTPVLDVRLQQGELDAALLALETRLSPVDHQVVAQDVFMLATARDDTLGARKAPAAAAELRGRQVLLLDEGHCLRDQALSWCTRARASEMEFRATSLTTLVQMVASGSGVTLLPALAVPVEAGRNRLNIRRMAAPQPGRTLALVWRKGSPRAAVYKKVATLLADSYARTTGSRALA